MKIITIVGILMLIGVCVAVGFNLNAYDEYPDSEKDAIAERKGNFEQDMYGNTHVDCTTNSYFLLKFDGYNVRIPTSEVCTVLASGDLTTNQIPTGVYNQK